MENDIFHASTGKNLHGKMAIVELLISVEK